MVDGEIVSGSSFQRLTMFAYPPINAFALFSAAKAAHLLARVPFPSRQRPNFFTNEARLFREICQDEIDGHLFPVILNVVIYHYHDPSWRNDPPQLAHYNCHFEEVAFDHSHDVRIAQLVLDVVQNF